MKEWSLKLGTTLAALITALFSAAFMIRSYRNAPSYSQMDLQTFESLLTEDDSNAPSYSQMDSQTFESLLTEDDSTKVTAGADVEAFVGADSMAKFSQGNKILIQETAGAVASQRQPVRFMQDFSFEFEDVSELDISFGNDISEKHEVDDGLRNALSVPQASATYAFAYPGDPSKGHAFEKGAFVFYDGSPDGSERVVAIKKIAGAHKVNRDDGHNEDAPIFHMRGWQQKKDHAEDDKDRCTDGVFYSFPKSVFNQVNEFCWKPECLSNLATSGKQGKKKKSTGGKWVDVSLGCFAFSQHQSKWFAVGIGRFKPEGDDDDAHDAVTGKMAKQVHKKPTQQPQASGKMAKQVHEKPTQQPQASTRAPEESPREDQEEKNEASKLLPVLKAVTKTKKEPGLTLDEAMQGAAIRPVEISVAVVVALLIATI